MESGFEPENVVLSHEEYAYAFIVEVLTQGLYPDKFHVIREYVQNAFDATLEWRRRANLADAGRISITVSNPSIFIYDEGTGMDRGQLSKYRYVGYSEKRVAEGVGFRGIGKLSGLSVAERLIVTTSPPGIGRRYRLEFDSNKMIAKIYELKNTGNNISLNDLIRKYTRITEEEEEEDTHYTLIELHKINQDCATLLDSDRLASYVAANAPVPFHPGFAHREVVDDWLRRYVDSYETVNLVINGEEIYKPYVIDIKHPQMYLIKAPSSEEPIAFCWYCEHTVKGQFEDRELRGLIYRLKNFAIGDNQLPRNSLWKASPERAFYFFGEIHIICPDIIPSSSRDNFEQNRARDELYRFGNEFSSRLNYIAGKSSDQRRAIDHIDLAASVVSETQRKIDNREIVRETLVDTIFEVKKSRDEVKKRIKKAPDEYKDRGNILIAEADKLLDQLSPRDDSADPVFIYDITKELKLSGEGMIVYRTIMDSIHCFFEDSPETYARLVQCVHEALSSRLGKKSP